MAALSVVLLSLMAEIADMIRFSSTVLAGFVITFGLVLFAFAFRPDSNRPSVRMELGQRFINSGDYDRAIEVFDAVLKEIPQHAVALHLRGLAYDRLGEIESAFADYNRAIEIDPAYFDAINDRGILSTRAGHWREGLADFRRLIGLEPNNTSARVNYAFALQKAGRLDEAAACLDVIDGSQRDETVEYLRACIAMSQRDWVSADAALSAAIEIDSNDLKMWLNRAISRWRLGRTAEAISDLNQAAGLDEDWMLQGTIAELRLQIEGSQPQADSTADLARP